MRLWYQSLTRPTAWAAYNEALRAALDATPTPEQIAELRSFYGPVYPWPKTPQS